jgi:hypothetical protein
MFPHFCGCHDLNALIEKANFAIALEKSHSSYWSEGL